MIIKMYQQTRTITAPRSRNKKYAITRTGLKTDFTYITELDCSESFEILEQALVYLENIEGFKALSIAYLADSVADKWTVKFTVEGELEDLPLDIEINTNSFNEEEDLI